MSRKNGTFLAPREAGGRQEKKPLTRKSPTAQARGQAREGYLSPHTL